MKYTEQDVRDAFFASSIVEQAKAEGVTPEEEAVQYFPKEEHQDLLSSLCRGQEILTHARIVRSERRTFQIETLKNVDSPIVFCDSGYLATSQSWIEVALKGMV